MHSQPEVTFRSILRYAVASSSFNPNHQLFQIICPHHHVQAANAPMPNERGIGEPQTEVPKKFLRRILKVPRSIRGAPIRSLQWNILFRDRTQEL